jgi:hypothetical protein
MVVKFCPRKPWVGVVSFLVPARVLALVPARVLARAQVLVPAQVLLQVRALRLVSAQGR